MHPVLFRIGWFEVHAYGLLLALSFILGIYWALRRAKSRRLNPNHIMDLALIVVIGAIVGSRLLYVFTHVDEFKGRWIKMISPVEDGRLVGISGLTMLGGVVLALIGIVLYCSIKKVNLLKLCDVMAPSFGLGIFLTRIGCFLNGCCYGRSCEYMWKEVFPPWGVVFPSFNNPAGAAHPHVHIHPTQLYASLYGLFIVITLILLDRKKHFDGYIMSVFLMLYGFFRFWIDFIRDYESSVQFHLLGQAFTVNQAISFMFFCLGLTLLIIMSRPRSAETKKP